MGEKQYVYDLRELKLVLGKLGLKKSIGLDGI